MSALVALGVLVVVAVLVAATLAGPALARLWRRQRITQRPFPAAWRTILRRRVPLARELPAAQQLRLKKRIQVLLAEVPFIGCAGLKVTDEMRVTIAAQAALLLLGRGGSFGNLREVLVYPGHFVVPRSEAGPGGVVHEGRDVLAGQSWQRGQVIVAWDAVRDGAADPHDGANVVVHEFAHQLDQDTGVANGAPYVGRGALQQAWARVMGDEFQALHARLARDEPGVLAPYAATNAAEFFAVASEHFFEQPAALAAERPALYEQLKRCYRLDPAAW
ncbi:zinc-dependent peptidase [Ideonella sp. A 288]|uniref:M90 family metallopeptidase n=1 Tax=Ideonella sp. A 288 TaxID=1962181 RepID=UPI0018FE859D|nr:M90 family metallopeptidase [Ideonella sp. A 288]